ncbi:GPI-anchored small secreted protein [Infundibulicybe gibba]|nr:GPI-anchored small secreted protein [Infundibulicybe gibba]
MRFPFASALCALIPAGVYSITLPNADTPLFHLVSSSSNAEANLLPLRTSGGSNGGAALKGSGPIGQFYFLQGNFVAFDQTLPTTSPTFRPLINSVLTGNGCTPGGSLIFVQGFGSNKCARSGNFWIHSNEENSQLGANLVQNWVGGFYACGTSLDVRYEVSPADVPAGCTAVDLYTVPVA